MYVTGTKMKLYIPVLQTYRDDIFPYFETVAKCFIFTPTPHTILDPIVE